MATARLICPRCKTPLEIDDSQRALAFCPSCGARELVSADTLDGQAPADTHAPLAAVPTAPASSPSSDMPKPAELPTTVAYPGTPEQPNRPASAWPEISGYEILDVLGRGGMGVVYKARHLKLNRVVALKMIKEKGHDSAESFEQFQKEAEAVAAFQHPNIVQIHEIGTHDGCPYFTLEYMDGGSLHDKLKGVPQEPRDSALLVETIARAMHYAHQRRIIHRDLKPLNVLLASPLPVGEGSRGSGVRGFGVPKVADFGLAKLLPQEAEQAETQMIRGTPPYMAPEQASHEAKRIGPATDVYALGAVLYEMLTGRPPFQGKNVLETLDLVRTQEPVPPRQLQPKVPRDLETICLKCLEKEPGKRYTSAEALAEDLRRFQAGEPVLARPVSRLERGWRWCRRNPLPAGLAGSVLATLVVGLVVASALATWALQEAARAVAQESKTKEQMSRAEKASYNHVIALTQREIENNNVGRAIDVLADCGHDLRRWEFYYLSGVCQRRMRTFKGHTAEVSCVTFSPDGKYLASSSGDQSVRVWRRDGQEVLTLQGHEQLVHHVAYSPDGRLLASASWDGKVKVWNVAAGKQSGEFKCDSRVTCVAFSPDTLRLAAANRNREVIIWDLSEGRELHKLKGHTGGVEGVAFSPDGKTLATASNDQTVKIWNAASGAVVATLQGHKAWVGSVAFSPDRQRLASASGDGTVILWDATTHDRLVTFMGHSAEVTCVAFSSDGHQLASASADQTVKIWDAADGLALLTFQGHAGPISSVAFSPDDKELASAGHDQTVRIWDVSTPQELAISQETHSLQGHLGQVNQVAFSPDGHRLASAGMDKSAKVWDAVGGSSLFSLEGHHAPVMSVAFSPSGKVLATASADGVLKIWDANHGGEVLSFRGHDLPACSVAFRGDGRQLASAGSDQSVKIWDVSSGRCLYTLKGHAGAVLCVRFSPDGERLLSGGEDKTVRVWDIAGERELFTLEGHSLPVWSVAFSPDGERLASGGWDKLVRVWDAASGNELHTLRGHTAYVSGVAFHPDGQRLASSSDDKTIKVWDLASGREVMTFKGHAAPFIGLAFSPDGRRLAAGCGDQTVKIWDAPGFAPVEIAAGAAGNPSVSATRWTLLLSHPVPWVGLLVFFGMGVGVLLWKRKKRFALFSFRAAPGRGLSR